MRKILPLIVFLLFFVSVASPVQAPADIDITTVPERVGELFGIPASSRAFVGGVLMTSIIFLVFVMPCLLLRNKSPAMIMSFLVLCFCVSVEWLPTWIMLVIVLIISLSWASKIKRMWT